LLKPAPKAKSVALPGEVSDFLKQPNYVDRPIGFLATLLQSAEKAPAVLVIGKDSFLVVAAIHKVVDRAGILETQLPRPGER
jgi:hypothetical protein